MSNAANLDIRRRGCRRVLPGLVPLPLVVLLVVLLGGCAWAYKPELQQGNVVTRYMLSSIKVGMSRREVQSLLGTPLIADMFHDNRWDYYYSRTPDNKEKDIEVLQNRVTVYFEGDVLVRIDDLLSADPPGETRSPRPERDPDTGN